MFSSEYKANFQAVNSDLLLHAVIKSGGDIPLQQAEHQELCCRQWGTMFCLFKTVMSLLTLLLFPTSTVFISSFNNYIFMLIQCYHREYKD